MSADKILTLPPASCGGDCECHLADPRVTAQVEAIEDWTRRREDKKLRIADECLEAIRLRGLDPDELGISRTKICGALFAVTESDLDEIIERTQAVPS